jgi:Cu/Ag efflux protein CusF
MREPRQDPLRVSFFIVMGMALLIVSCQKSNSPVTSPSPRTDNPQAGPKGPPGFPPAVMDKPYTATGVVVQINRPEGWIEINHDEIKDLMPAMQMEFWVRDKSLLDKVKPGDRVDFTIVETTGGEYLTELKRSEKGPAR